MNPYYNYFKEMSGSGSIDPNEDIGKIYKTVLYQRGFGFDSEIDFHTTYGLGFADTVQGILRMITPFFKSGLKYLGSQAVNTAANIAQDVIAGSNVKDAAKTHVTQTAEEIFAKAPEAIANVVKGNASKRSAVSQSQTLVEAAPPYPAKRRRYTQKKGKKLLQIYPALGRISNKK